MEEIKKVYFTPKEVAEKFGVNISNVRFWDSEYGILKRESGESRKYNSNHMKTFARIKILLHFLNSEGVKQVMAGRINVQVDDDLIDTYV